MLYLGIDTSNYTTSAAIYDPEASKAISCKKLLPVKKGELGLRQSDAVFHHTVQLPELLEQALSAANGEKIKAVCVSSRPRDVEGSYMPCFLTGVLAARSISAALNAPLYKTSHQQGHIIAALYSSDSLDLFGKRFLSYHVSGGTTEAVLINGEEGGRLKAQSVGGTLDLNAGQAIDRVGLMLGLDFPCGKALEQLADSCGGKKIKVKPTLKGVNCCLSGLENQCRKLLSQGEAHEYIAAYCLEYIYESINQSCKALLEEYGEMPIVFAGGVMSDKIIRNKLEAQFKQTCFAQPEFSCDNAAGVAVSGYLMDRQAL